MKYYTISFPGECGQHVQETWSEEQIMKSNWYRNWVYMMVQADKHHLMTEQIAIDDWCAVHWAVETDEFGYRKDTPPECTTDAERTAFAFGWWKAIESVKQKQNNQYSDITSNGGMDPRI